MHQNIYGLALAVLFTTASAREGQEYPGSARAMLAEDVTEVFSLDFDMVDGIDVDLPALTEEETERDRIRSLIVDIAQTYHVPSGAIYGIWMQESNGLRGRWGTPKYWHSASALTSDYNVCADTYSARWCRDQWRALKRICAQTRAADDERGTRVCDPTRVRTSYAMALGPMQHMPASLLLKVKGRYAWSRHAVDFDSDGVIDPFDLPDAMASAAKFIRSHHDRKVGRLGEKRAWVYAINRYYGSQSAGYYEGDGSSRGVRHHWKEWCKNEGGCSKDAHRTEITMVMTPP